MPSKEDSLAQLNKLAAEAGVKPKPPAVETIKPPQGPAEVAGETLKNVEAGVAEVQAGAVPAEKLGNIKNPEQRETAGAVNETIVGEARSAAAEAKTKIETPLLETPAEPPAEKSTESGTKERKEKVSLGYVRSIMESGLGLADEDKVLSSFRTEYSPSGVLEEVTAKTKEAELLSEQTSRLLRIPTNHLRDEDRSGAKILLSNIKSHYEFSPQNLLDRRIMNIDNAKTNFHNQVVRGAEEALAIISGNMSYDGGDPSFQALQKVTNGLDSDQKQQLISELTNKLETYKKTEEEIVPALRSELRQEGTLRGRVDEQTKRYYRARDRLAQNADKLEKTLS